MIWGTLPETDITPENGLFLGAMLVLGSQTHQTQMIWSPGQTKDHHPDLGFLSSSAVRWGRLKVVEQNLLPNGGAFNGDLSWFLPIKKC